MTYEIYEHGEGCTELIDTARTLEIAEWKVDFYKRCRKGVYYSWMRRKEAEDFKGHKYEV